MIQIQGFPLSFPEHLPPKTRVCLLYCTVLFTLLTFSGKKSTQGFSLLHMKGMSQLNPFDGFLTYLTGLLYNLWIVYSHQL